MKIENIKKRISIISEKIERIEELQSFIENAGKSEYYTLFGSVAERDRDISGYLKVISIIEESINNDIEFLNKLK